jgi:hypothetical protein
VADAARTARAGAAAAAAAAAAAGAAAAAAAWAGAAAAAGARAEGPRASGNIGTRRTWRNSPRSNDTNCQAQKESQRRCTRPRSRDRSSSPSLGKSNTGRCTGRDGQTCPRDEACAGTTGIDGTCTWHSCDSATREGTWIAFSERAKQVRRAWCKVEPGGTRRPTNSGIRIVFITYCWSYSLGVCEHHAAHSSTALSAAMVDSQLTAGGDGGDGGGGGGGGGGRGGSGGGGRHGVHA